jgi:hypothetical protein
MNFVWLLFIVALFPTASALISGGMWSRHNSFNLSFLKRKIVSSQVSGVHSPLTFLHCPNRIDGPASSRGFRCFRNAFPVVTKGKISTTSRRCAQSQAAIRTAKDANAEPCDSEDSIDNSLCNGGQPWECDMLGLKIRGLQWGDRTTPNKALCVHGFMDNAMSFAALAPLLLEDGRRLHIVAIDLPGHGLSDHFPPYVAYRPEVSSPPRIARRCSTPLPQRHLRIQ